jgi:hypothetical protein
LKKDFSLIRPFTHTNKKTKYCVTCGNIATQEAFFNIGEGAILIERYCDVCSKKELS